MPLLPPGVHEQFPAERDQLTPLFRQYTEIKAQYPEALLLYRLGDFYEMFGPDAVRGAELLGLTLTSRACRKGYKVAMCGIPHHASVRYIKRLVKAGATAAICEQTEDPAAAKGLVERAVTRVITAGTLVEDDYLSADAGNFLAVLAERGGRWGLALLESSGGRVELSEHHGGPARALLERVLRHRPAEVLAPRGLLDDPAFSQPPGGLGGPVVRACEPAPQERDVVYFLERYFNTNSLDSFGIGSARAAQAALFVLIRYLKETFKVGQVGLYPILVPPEDWLYLDAKAAAHLELLSSLDPLARGNGLYDILNRCLSSAGRRQLKARLLAPYANAEAIVRRHTAVELLVHGRELADRLAGLMRQIQDVERIVQRVTLRRTHPKELRALCASLPPLSELGQSLIDSGDPCLAELAARIGGFEQLYEQLELMLAEDPPVRLSDGGVIRAGADGQVDELRDLVHGGHSWFADYQEQERERTGVRTLKVKHTGAFGYFIEVSKANLALVPDDYERRQTLVNHERFVTAELSKRESEMQGAEVRLLGRERELFEQLCTLVGAEAAQLASAARAAAEADVLLSLAMVAREREWVRPELGAGEEGPVRLEIEGGRHPIVEQAVGERHYTPADCFLTTGGQQIMVLTGPNMGGKSTYLRMVALCCIINQLGGFVPASKAVLPVMRRIYTRVGAQDYLARGQSTFMVEMVETAEILNTCSGHSLVLLDEVGRGTSTYDGISIAKAVVEFLHEHPRRPLTLFATHFFELTDLEHLLERVRNFQVTVAREEGRFVFLYRVEPGAASDSYGIEVAALAGLPEQVVERARQILRELEEVKDEARARARKAIQLGLFKGGPSGPDVS